MSGTEQRVSTAQFLKVVENLLQACAGVGLAQSQGFIPGEPLPVAAASASSTKSPCRVLTLSLDEA
eukprot:12907619-Prorocentrum_lima.AAC.1